MYSAYGDKLYICSKCKKATPNHLVNKMCEDCIRRITWIKVIKILKNCLMNCKKTDNVNL